MTFPDKRLSLEPKASPSLPYVSAHLKGVGGEIKSEPEHFIVREIPLYEASGEGDHVYLKLTRKGMTTRALEKRLAEIFSLEESDIGVAGQKDKVAFTTQTFSLNLRNSNADEVAKQVEAEVPVTIEAVSRHRNKLKRGHLLGNQFEILLVDAQPGALEVAQAVADCLAQKGIANYFGVQRFGNDGDNAIKGKQVLLGKARGGRWLKKFLLSAYQSSLFNKWLVWRQEQGYFEQILTGDVAKKVETGGIFVVEDIDVDRPRFESREITYTGPIYGNKMHWPNDLVGDYERALLASEEISMEMLTKARLSGSRRIARLFLEDLTITQKEAGLCFQFSLPKGSYATNVLREFMKNEDALPDLAARAE